MYMYMYVCKHLFDYSSNGSLDHSLEVGVAPLPRVYTHGADSHHFKLGFMIFKNSMLPLCMRCFVAMAMYELPFLLVRCTDRQTDSHVLDECHNHHCACVRWLKRRV